MPLPVLVALADAFAAAAVDETLWLPALARLASATKSARAQIVGVQGSGITLFEFVNDIDATMLRDFEAVRGFDPHANYRMAAGMTAPVLTIVDERHYDRRMPGPIADGYRDFCRDHRMPHGCQSTLFGPAGGLVGFALLRSEQDGPTTADQRALFGAAALHARAAVQVQRLLERDRTHLMLGAFDAMEIAAFVCDAQGVVRHRTPRADAVLRDGRLRLIGQRLESRSHPETDTLRLLIGRAGAVGNGTPGIARMLIRGDSPAIPIALDIVALPQRAPSFDLAPGILIAVRGTTPDRDRATALLRMAYALSQSEADIAIALAEGISRDDIAQRRDVSAATVRSQLKAIFQKLGIHREAELRAIVAPCL